MSVEPHAFGPFRLNPENGTLLRDGVLAPIGQKGALYRPGDSAGLFRGKGRGVRGGLAGDPQGLSGSGRQVFAQAFQAFCQEKACFVKFFLDIALAVLRDFKGLADKNLLFR